MVTPHQNSEPAQYDRMRPPQRAPALDHGGREHSQCENREKLAWHVETTIA
jgi:hypothetical protein